MVAARLAPTGKSQRNLELHAVKNVRAVTMQKRHQCAASVGLEHSLIACRPEEVHVTHARLMKFLLRDHVHAKLVHLVHSEPQHRHVLNAHQVNILQTEACVKTVWLEACPHSLARRNVTPAIAVISR